MSSPHNSAFKDEWHGMLDALHGWHILFLLDMCNLIIAQTDEENLLVYSGSFGMLLYLAISHKKKPFPS